MAGRSASPSSAAATSATQYLRNLTTFPDVQVLFCADLDTGRAKAQAAAYGVPDAGSVGRRSATPASSWS